MNDNMKIKEIIDGLKFTVDMFLFEPSTGEKYTEPRNDMDKTTIDACKGAIELLEQTRWIPVSERLPETDGVYTVTRRLFDNQIDTEPYYMVDACYFDGSNTWHNDNRINHGRHLLEDIIAWMPRPEPYKPESEV